MVTAPKFNSSPLKNDGTGRLVSFWEGPFSGAMLNFRGVIVGLGPGGLGFESGYP